MTERAKPKHHPGIREHHGRYQVRFYGPDHKRRSQSFRRLSDALDFQRDTRTDIKRGDWLDPARGAERLADCYSRFLARAKTTGRPSERTLIGWEQIWRQYVEPTLAARQLASITQEDCQAVVDSASSPWRARDVRKVLHRLMAVAVNERRIGRNPAASLDVPALERKEPSVLTMAEVDHLAESIEPRYAALVVVGAYSSLRWSELVGLRVQDVDFLRRRVRVERKIVESGKMIVGEPKTRGSKRWVTLPESVTLHLAEHVRQHVRGDVLFPGPNGGPLRRKTFHRAWRTASAAAGVPDFQFRNLRHTGATWALQEGVNPVLVAFRLGHRSTRMIEQHYGRLIESMDAEIAERLERTRPNGDQMGTKRGPAGAIDGLRSP